MISPQKNKEKKLSEKIQAVKGTAFWCDPHNINKLAGKYTMKLCRLDEKTVKAFRQAGVYISFDSKRDPESPDWQGYYVTLKSDAPVTVTDSAGNVLPSGLKIGNGSEVAAGFRINSFFHKDSGRQVTSLKWLGLKILSLVEYDPEAANRKKAAAVLDQISGEGFVFGESSDETTSNSSPSDLDTVDLDSLFEEE